jgi:hypothetical protein
VQGHLKQLHVSPACCTPVCYRHSSMLPTTPLAVVFRLLCRCWLHACASGASTTSLFAAAAAVRTAASSAALSCLDSTAFTDYIEFEHSDNSGNASDEETRLFPGGVHSQQHEERNFFGLLKDIWRVRATAATAVQAQASAAHDTAAAADACSAWRPDISLAGHGFQGIPKELTAAALCGSQRQQHVLQHLYMCSSQQTCNGPGGDQQACNACRRCIHQKRLLQAILPVTSD